MVGGLTNGTAYSFRLRGLNALAAGEVSAVVTATPTSDGSLRGRAPGVVSGLVGLPGVNSLAARGTHTGMKLSWSAPSDTGDSAVSGYQVEYKKESASGWTIWSSGGGMEIMTPAQAQEQCLDWTPAYSMRETSGGGQAREDY